MKQREVRIESESTNADTTGMTQRGRAWATTEAGVVSQELEMGEVFRSVIGLETECGGRKM